MSEDAGIADADNPIEHVIADDAHQARRGRYGWLSLAVAGVFGIFYAYDLWEAIGNLVNLPVFYSAFGLDSAQLPWWLLWVGVLIPPAVFAAAFLIGRRHPLSVKALVFFAGLAVVAALSLGVIALEQVLRPF
jgi:hypothetical protein